MAGTLNVQQFKVRSLSLDHNELTWEVEATTLDVLDYTFQVLRSESAEGPFDVLSEPFRDRYSYVDNAMPSLHRFRQLHYKLHVQHVRTGESWDVGPVMVEQESDLVSSELRSHINLLMREFIGERAWILPLRTFGQRCPSCWSTSLNKRTRSGCKTCWETGFVRGYMQPIESWISLDPSSAEEQPTPLGKQQQTNSTARLAYYPPTKPGDLLIFGANNERYKVTSVATVKHVGASIYQELRLHLMALGTLEYEVPLILTDALENLFLKPARTFTNPQQLDALDSKDYAELMTLCYPQGTAR